MLKCDKHLQGNVTWQVTKNAYCPTLLGMNSHVSYVMASSHNESPGE